MFLAVFFSGSSLLGIAAAQVDGTSDSDVLRNLQNPRGGPVDLTERALRPTTQTFQPVALDTPGAPSSRLERLYSDRIGSKENSPLQFGYSLLGVPTPVSQTQMGATQDKYLLGTGDELVIQLRGQENADYRVRVDRNGQIVLPKLNPISAAGRSLAAFRNDLDASVSRAFVSTNVFVTVSQMRQISVIVTGDVRSPGVRTLGALATPIDALLLSGGVSKTGSLRAVQLIRNGTIRQIDLYGLLVRGGNSMPLGTLQDGDKIFVPPIGATVAIVGAVKHEAIFELPRGAQSIDVRSLAQLAGGFEIAGTYRLTKLTLEADGTTRQVPVANNGIVRSGEILFVYSNRDVVEDRVTLAGAVRLPGIRPRSSFQTVGQLIRGVDDLNDDAYTLFTFIARRDHTSNTKILLPISLYRIFRGETDVPLQNNDVVYVLTADQVGRLAREANRADTATNDISSTGRLAPPPDDTNRNNGGSGPSGPPTPDVKPPQSSSLLASGSSSGGNLPSRAPSPDNRALGGEAIPGGTQAGTSGTQGRSAEDLADLDNGPEAVPVAQTLGVSSQTVLHMVTNNLVWIMGQVGNPRAYVAAPGTRLGDMLAIAGGALRDSDLSSVEVTSTIVDGQTGVSHTDRKTFSESNGDFKTVSIQPFDVIRVRPVFTDRQDGNVTVTGAVRYPGTFDIIRGERLSSLLVRAGGLTEQAYPYGAVFTRRSVAVAERLGNEREARALNSQLVTLVSGELGQSTSNSANGGEGAAQFLVNLSDQLRTAPVLGRMSIITDPAVLAVNPANDILLEPGDTLFVPVRPSTVTVSGEVLSAGAFRYDPKYSVSDYIRLAGGASQSADEGRIFVVLPDGSAAPRSDNWLTFDSHSLPPGATIVVPRDLSPFNLAQFLVTATQIIGQLAISAASISVVSRNN